MNARSLQEFWKRHHKFLGITGSGIVLLTFVVREALRENLKDASDAIANAQVYFSLSEKNDYIAHRLKYVSDATSTIYKDETEMREHRSFFGAASMNELTEYSNALGDFGNDSATFQQFADDLQCNATDRQELKTLQGNVQEIEKANQEAETSVTLSLAIEAMTSADRFEVSNARSRSAVISAMVDPPVQRFMISPALPFNLIMPSGNSST